MSDTPAAKVKERRQRERISQAELGSAIGFTQTWVSLFERGLIKPNRVTVQRMLAAITRISKTRDAVREATAKAEKDVLARIASEDRATNPA